MDQPASQPDGWSEAVLSNQETQDFLIHTGTTSENVASDFSFLDEFSAKSFQKAAGAQKTGKFRAGIVPLEDRRSQYSRRRRR
jgi:acetyl-CoA acyltransferase 1